MHQNDISSCKFAIIHRQSSPTFCESRKSFYISNAIFLVFNWKFHHVRLLQKFWLIRVFIFLNVGSITIDYINRRIKNYYLITSPKLDNSKFILNGWRWRQPSSKFSWEQNWLSTFEQMAMPILSDTLALNSCYCDQITPLCFGL